jgi:hypothetical protein
MPVANNEPDPADYEAWTAWREAGGGTEVDETPAAETSAEDENQPSEPLEEVSQESQTATESETAEDPEQEEAEAEAVDPEEPVVAAKPKTGLSKRMRELTGEIKSLKSQLEELKQPEVDDEGDAEVMSATEPVAEAEAVAPKLSDYEDTDAETQWDQYEKATRAFNQAETKKAIDTALTNQRQTLELAHSKAVADANWAKASERYGDYNDIVKNDGTTRVSPAMVAVVKSQMDPESGTDIAYYLATHKDEATKLADSTMANNVEEWNDARVRAAVAFGEIRAKIAIEKAAKAAAPEVVPPVVPPKVVPPAPKAATPKTVTTAPKPPTQVGRTAPAVKSDILTNPGDDDTDAWMKLRNAELAKSGQR